jgi:CIC family chloride channel protein
MSDRERADFTERGDIPTDRETITDRSLSRYSALAFAAFKTPIMQFVAFMRRDLRSNEIAQIVACAIWGAVVGAVVAFLRTAVLLLHRFDFAMTGNKLLSAGTGISPFRIIIIPALGGLVLAGLSLLVRRYRSNDIVDPVEANALYGGRMSLWDSLNLATATVVSNAAGASLGMEAGYTQLGSGIFSTLGERFRLRRADMRVFVTAGAAAAIAAAFNAPMAGIFYGYEMILGSYTPAALAPVAIAAVCAALAQRGLSQAEPLFVMPGSTPITIETYWVFGGMGIAAALLSILAMTGVTLVERLMRHSRLPDWLRPAVGGALLSAIALFFPQVLGSGHGGIQYHVENIWPILPLLMLLGAKVLASAISVGSGFRGGLFSSALFLGCIFGAICAQLAGALDPALQPERVAFLLVGMGSVAAGIIGAPFTMVFLVLEGTGDFPVAIGVLVSVITSSTIVRLLFGYSFATWRFHVRGLGLKGAHDIGWIADLTVARLMRSDPKLVSTGLVLRALREKYPPGSVTRVFAMAPDGHYAGWLDMAEVHDPQIDEVLEQSLVADLIRQPDIYLLPQENVRTALARFEAARTESLPVLASAADPRVIGYMTEAYALRRYTQELERRRSAELGERNLFSLHQASTG